MKTGYCWNCMAFIGYMRDESINKEQRHAHKKCKQYLVVHTE